MTINIPGLLAKLKDDDKQPLKTIREEMSKAMQAKVDQEVKTFQESWKKSGIHYSSVEDHINDLPDYRITTTQMTPEQVQQMFNQQPLTTTPLIDMNTFKWQYNPPYQQPSIGQGIAPNPLTRRVSPYKPQTTKPFDYQSTQDRLNDMLNPKQKDMGDLLSEMYDVNEKAEFLLTLGYNRLLFSGIPPGEEPPYHDNDIFMKPNTIDNMDMSSSLNQMFKMEITKKFKHLLMSKGTIKMKL